MLLLKAEVNCSLNKEFFLRITYEQLRVAYDWNENTFWSENILRNYSRKHKIPPVAR